MTANNSQLLAFEYPNNTITLLNLIYILNHCPALVEYVYDLYNIDKPSKKYTYWRSCHTPLPQYNTISHLFKPYATIWIECHCIAALIPNPSISTISNININGYSIYHITITFEKQRDLHEIHTLITTCDAIISGGGYLSYGRHRGYTILFDIPKPLAKKP